MGASHTGLKRNGTGELFITVKGSLDTSMSCQGEKFNDGKDEYTAVVVKDYIRTYHKKYWGTVELESQTLKLFEGYKAMYKEGYLFTKELGTIVWDAPTITCFEQFTPLYNGQGTILSSKDLPSMVYINEPKLGGQVFVELVKSDLICKQTGAYSTGVDGIYVQIVSNGIPAFFPKEKEKLDPLNMAITRFIQTKTGFVFRKLQMDLYDHYTSWYVTNCYIENELWKTKMQQLMLHPDTLGINPLSKKKGVVAKKRGDVLYLMECDPVLVSLGVPKFCTHELPVRYNGTNYFLMPNSHILTKRANRVICSALTPVLHCVDGIWYINDGKSISIVPAPAKAKSSLFHKDLLTFQHFRVDRLDENGLYKVKEMKKSHALFLESHEVNLVNEDIGQGILHGSNAYSYDLSPVSSSTGFLHWAQKTSRQYFGALSFVADGFCYFVMVVLAYIFIVTANKLTSVVFSILKQS